MFKIQPAVPAHTNINVTIKANVPPNLSKKVALIHINDRQRKRGKKATEQNGFYASTTREWGDFTLDVDTIPPKIKVVNFVPNSIHKRSTLQFKVWEELTTLHKYNGYIDDQWALFEYNEKKDLMIYTIDYERIEKNTWHNIKFVAEDELNNVGEFSCKLYF
jgi:hypothetical protein